MCDNCENNIENEEDTEYNEGNTEDLVDNTIEAMFFAPIGLNTENLVDICEYDINEFQNGIKEVSKECGMFTALLSSGMTNVQAYDLLLTKIGMDFQKEINIDNNKTSIEVSKYQSIMIDKNQP
jgi:hypothetical protein